MKKGFLLILLITIIGMCAYPCSAASENDENAELSVVCDLLSHIGVQAQADDAELNAPMTRAEYAGLLSRVLDTDTAAAGSKRYFPDVEAGSAINILAERGIFWGDGDGFRPDSPISEQEVVISLVRAVGYEPYVKVRGRDLQDYLLTAKKLGIIQSFAQSRDAAREYVLRAVYNTLHIELYELQSIVGDTAVYGAAGNGGGTILSEIHDIYWTTGQVTDNGITSFTGRSNAGDGYAVIGGEQYRDSSRAAADYIGYDVLAYYKSERTGGNREILFVYPKNGNKIFEFGGDGTLVTQNEISFYTEDYSEKCRRSFDLSKDTVIKNGVALNGNIYAELQSIGKNSSFRLVENKFGKVLICCEFENALVRLTDSARGLIYTDHDGRFKEIDIKNAAETVHIVSPGSNREEDIYSIGKDALISVELSSDGSYMKIYICNKLVSGTVSKISKKGGTAVTVDGGEYVLADGFETKYNSFGLGSSGIFKLDKLGHIGAWTQRTQSNLTIGYLYRAAYKNEAFKDVLTVKIYNEKKEHAVLECEKTVKLNGSAVTSDVLYSRLLKSSGELQRQLVQYRVNTDGKLCELYTAAFAKEDRAAENGIWQVAPKALRYYKKDGRTFDDLYPLGASTIVFCVPGENITPDEDLFRLTSYSYFAENEHSVTLYKLTDENPYVDIVVYSYANRTEIEEVQSSEMDYKTDIILINEIVREINSRGETAYKLTGLRNGGAVELFFAENDPNGIIATLDSGDIIRTKANYDNEIYLVEKVFDYSEQLPEWNRGKNPEEYTFSNTWFYDETRYAYGYLDRKYVYYIAPGKTPRSVFTVKDFYNPDYFEIFTLNTAAAKLIVYDGERRGYKAYKGSVNEIADRQSTENGFAKVFLQYKEADIAAMIFYK